MESHGNFWCPQTLGGLHFAHVRHGGLFFGATTEGDASPFTIIEFLNRLVTLLRDFCGPLNEKSLGMNLGLVGELLEELVDFGHIQTTSPEVLRSLVQSEPEAPKPFSLLDLGSVGLFGAETQQSRVVPGGAATRPLPPPRGDQMTLMQYQVMDELPAPLPFRLFPSLDTEPTG
ncbi:AP-4 complex subunit mu-1, partial [Geospiza fortis]|uniref:AP-4 complex subunit mu-1 n=1 Tax=Geospiza fortis TaxID=48883 RepID=A0A8N5F121_GEOFO